MRGITQILENPKTGQKREFNISSLTNVIRDDMKKGIVNGWAYLIYFNHPLYKECDHLVFLKLDIQINAMKTGLELFALYKDVNEKFIFSYQKGAKNLMHGEKVTHKSDVIAAFRHAISEIPPVGMVNHHVIAFKELLHNFFSGGFPYEKIKIGSLIGGGHYILDSSLRTRWKHYHDIHAVLKKMTIEEHKKIHQKRKAIK